MSAPIPFLLPFCVTETNQFVVKLAFTFVLHVRLLLQGVDDYLFFLAIFCVCLVRTCSAQVYTAALFWMELDLARPAFSLLTGGDSGSNAH